MMIIRGVPHISVLGSNSNTYTAKVIEDVSYTACGSPMYMAPEFLKSKGKEGIMCS